MRLFLCISFVLVCANIAYGQGPFGNNYVGDKKKGGLGILGKLLGAQHGVGNQGNKVYNPYQVTGGQGQGGANYAGQGQAGGHKKGKGKTGGRKWGKGKSRHNGKKNRKMGKKNRKGARKNRRNRTHAKQNANAY